MGWRDDSNSEYIIEAFGILFDALGKDDTLRVAVYLRTNPDFVSILAAFALKNRAEREQEPKLPEVFRFFPRHAGETSIESGDRFSAQNAQAAILRAEEIVASETCQGGSLWQLIHTIEKKNP